MPSDALVRQLPQLSLRQTSSSISASVRSVINTSISMIAGISRHAIPLVILFLTQANGPTVSQQS